jgi:hypothetical protein
MSLTKIAGSGSGSVSQTQSVPTCHGSATLLKRQINKAYSRINYTHNHWLMLLFLQMNICLMLNQKYGICLSLTIVDLEPLDLLPALGQSS